MKLKDKLKLLQKAAPKCTPHGQLYKNKAETERTYSKVILHCLFRSDQNTLMMREHVFVKKYESLTPEQWSAFFARDLAKIHHEGVLPGMFIRTGKSWGVDRIIGWVGDAEHKPIDPETDSPRAKANHKRRKNG